MSESALSDVRALDTPVDDVASFHRARASLTVRTELRRQFSLRRTRLALGLVVVLPVLLVAAFEFGGDEAGDLWSLAALATFSAANFTVFTLGASAGFLLMVIVALVCGDAVAGDASNGSLRYLLALPVSRGRLLGVKLLASLATSAVALVALTVTALGVGVAAFGRGPLRTPRGDALALAEAAARIGGMVVYVAVTLLVVAALAFWLSTTTDAPLAAVGGAVLVVIVSTILDQVSALGAVRTMLPTHYADSWRGLFDDPMQLEAMARGSLATVIYAGFFLACAWWTFLRKDVLS
ncbi:ABC transporter permease subunit [Actinopolymorpha sp. B9G3]|uniref:ABC transporter permease n=1 Tax=Actinopolymorpha sp. B9G3 TaxID=3158970 RepID=UPI0032D8E44D